MVKKCLKSAMLTLTLQRLLSKNEAMTHNTDTAADSVVLKPTGTVQIANRFSLVERKLLNTLMFYAQQRRFAPQEHSLPVADVFYHIGLESSRNHDVLKAAIRKLTGTVVEWNVFGDDRAQEWGVCTFLASGKLARGKIRFRINPEIIDQITHPRLFAKIQLLVQAQFKRRHALVLYEFLVDCISRQRASKLVIKDVSLSKLHQLMGLEDTKYAEDGNFKIFNRDIIKPSIEDLNQHSDLQVDIDPVRQSRRVIALNFIVERNTSFQVLLGLDEDEPGKPSAKGKNDHKTKRRTQSHSATNKEPTQHNDQTWLNQLTEYGISQRKAKSLSETYDEARINTNVDFVKEKIGNGKEIKNIAAYLVCAIEEDYYSTAQKQTSAAAGNNDPQKANSGKRSASNSSKQQQALRKDWQKFKQERARQVFAKLSNAQQEQHRQAFLNSGTLSGSCQTAFNQHGGWDNPLVMHTFIECYLVKQLLTAPEETSWDVFCDQQKSKENTL